MSDFTSSSTGGSGYCGGSASSKSEKNESEYMEKPPRPEALGYKKLEEEEVSVSASLEAKDVPPAEAAGGVLEAGAQSSTHRYENTDSRARRELSRQNTLSGIEQIPTDGPSLSNPDDDKANLSTTLLLQYEGVHRPSIDDNTLADAPSLSYDSTPSDSGKQLISMKSSDEGEDMVVDQVIPGEITPSTDSTPSPGQLFHNYDKKELRELFLSYGEKIWVEDQYRCLKCKNLAFKNLKVNCSHYICCACHGCPELNPAEPYSFKPVNCGFCKNNPEVNRGYYDIEFEINLNEVQMTCLICKRGMPVKNGASHMLTHTKEELQPTHKF